jgi:hypothetical protein
MVWKRVAISARIFGGIGKAGLVIGIEDSRPDVN